jgi:hypothetical protein
VAGTPDRLAGGEVWIGRYLAWAEAIRAMNVRATFRELTGHQPGAEVSIPKLVIAENAHDAADMLVQLAGADSILGTGVGAIANQFPLSCVALAIAGGTSEIKRNQIGERVLGLPRAEADVGAGSMPQPQPEHLTDLRERYAIERARRRQPVANQHYAYV